MEELFGLFVIIIGAIASIASAKKSELAKKAALEKHKAAAAARVQAAQQRQTVQQRPAVQQQAVSAVTPSPQIAVPVQMAIPTVHPHIKPDCATHDVPGSLGVTSMEGKDPCHEEELTLERTFAEVSEPEGGLTFDWTGENLVKAFVMQEVLTRPAQRRAM